ARDLLGAADLPAVGRELAALAEVCLGCALDLVAPEVPLGIIAMGKLGGRELNYASDVDVLFVHEGDGAVAERAARAVLTTMSEPTADGIVFRTDADLRPEGRSGPLSRTPDPSGRSSTTLDALAQLASGGYIEREEAAQLDDAYRFLRTVEHRLQLQDEQQTHTLPADVGARTRLARVLGYRDRGDETALD